MGTNRNRYLGTNRQTERATVNTIKQLHIEKTVRIVRIAENI